MKKDHMEILLEDIQGKFELVLEGHDAIRQEMRDIRDELNEKIDLNTMGITALNKKIDDVDARLSQKIDDVDARLSQKIDAVDARLSRKIDAVDARLSQKIDAVDARLSRKIDAVDASLSQKLDAVGADLAAHRADTESHGRGYRVSDG